MWPDDTTIKNLNKIPKKNSKSSLGTNGAIIHGLIIVSCSWEKLLWNFFPWVPWIKRIKKAIAECTGILQNYAATFFKIKRRHDLEDHDGVVLLRFSSSSNNSLTLDIASSSYRRVMKNKIGVRFHEESKYVFKARDSEAETLFLTIRELLDYLHEEFLDITYLLQTDGKLLERSKVDFW